MTKKGFIYGITGIHHPKGRMLKQEIPKPKKKIMVECVNAHDKCYEGGECSYCEPVVPLRNTDGTFRGLDNG